MIVLVSAYPGVPTAGWSQTSTTYRRLRWQSPPPPTRKEHRCRQTPDNHVPPDGQGRQRTPYASPRGGDHASVLNQRRTHQPCFMDDEEPIVDLDEK